MLSHFVVKSGECVPMPRLLNYTQSKYLSTQYVCVWGEIVFVGTLPSFCQPANQGHSPQTTPASLSNPLTSPCPPPPVYTN